MDVDIREASSPLSLQRINFRKSADRIFGERLALKSDLNEKIVQGCFCVRNMGRGPRFQRKLNPRKRGRKGFAERASLPKRAGLKKRSQYRKNKKKSPKTMKRYRTFFRFVHRADLAGPYIARCCKGLPPPGSYDKKNQHGGVMPALPGDFELQSKKNYNPDYNWSVFSVTTNHRDKIEI